MIMPRFHRLAVSDLRRETNDSVSIAFLVPEALRAAYRFTPGQYLTLRVVIDGKDCRRSYSICSAPEDHDLRVAIKRQPNGVFSSWAQSEVHAGDFLDVMTPQGRFGLDVRIGQRGTFLAFAAGSGITP